MLYQQIERIGLPAYEEIVVAAVKAIIDSFLSTQISSEQVFNDIEEDELYEIAFRGLSEDIELKEHFDITNPNMVCIGTKASGEKCTNKAPLRNVCCHSHRKLHTDLNGNIVKYFEYRHVKIQRVDNQVDGFTEAIKSARGKSRKEPIMLYSTYRLSKFFSKSARPNREVDRDIFLVSDAAMSDGVCEDNFFMVMENVVENVVSSDSSKKSNLNSGLGIVGLLKYTGERKRPYKLYSTGSISDGEKKIVNEFSERYRVPSFLDDKMPIAAVSATGKTTRLFTFNVAGANLLNSWKMFKKAEEKARKKRSSD